MASFGSLSTFRSEVEVSRTIKKVSSLSRWRLDAFLAGSCGALGVHMTHFYVFRSIWCMCLQGTFIIQQRQATFLTKSIVLTKISMINMYRDIGYYWLRFAIYIGLFLTIGAIFFNVGYNYASIQISGDSESR
jgi:hypothetical protein